MGHTPYGMLAQFVLSHRKATTLAFIALVLLSAVIGLPPKVNPNLLALLPDSEPSSVALRKLHAEEGGVNLVTLAFESNDEPALQAFVDELTEEFEALENVRYAISKAPEDLATQVALMHLNTEDLVQLNHRLQGALALGPAMNNPVVASRLLAMGPLTEKISKASEQSVLMSSQKGIAKILVKPTGSSVDNKFSVALMADVHRLVDPKIESHPEIKLVWIGGGYRHNVEDMKGIEQDILWTSGASVLLVLLVLVVSFRGWRTPIMVFIPLIAANIINLGLVRLTLGPLNTYTSFGTAILIGLGIDFAIHLMARYRELRHRDYDVEEAIIEAWNRTGPPCATAAFTSAAGFLALAAARFQGFSQMGILLAMGLLVCLAAMLVMLPLLISVMYRNPKPPVTPTFSGSTGAYAFAPLGLMLLVFATGAVAIFKVPHIGWEFDVSNLRRDGLSYDQLTDTERALAKESYAPIVVSYRNERRLRRAQKRIQASIDDGDLPHLDRALSILDIIPDDQDVKLEQLRALQQKIRDPNSRYLPPPIRNPLLPLKDLSLEPISRSTLPDPIKELLGAGKEEHHRLMLVPKGNMWDLRETAELEEEVVSVVRKAPAAGEYVAMGALYRTVIRDMPVVGMLALLMVAILTALDLRDPVRIAGAMGTLLAGMVWAGATLQITGVHISLLNVVGVPILLGIGVDMIIHLLHRLGEEGPGGVRRALATTGIAAGLSALTTILSFLSLTLAGNRGVQSLGLLVCIGLLAIVVATTILLPTAWAAGWSLSGQDPHRQKND